MNERLSNQWDRLCDRWSAEGYASLSDDEKVWLNVRALIDSVENSGLISYFYNSGADTYEDCLSALRRLKAVEVVDQVSRLGALFGDAVPSSLEERNVIINSWSDEGQENEVAEEADEVLMPLMAGLDKQLDEYLLRQGFGR